MDRQLLGIDSNGNCIGAMNCAENSHTWTGLGNCAGCTAPDRLRAHWILRGRGAVRVVYVLEPIFGRGVIIA